MNLPPALHKITLTLYGKVIAAALESGRHHIVDMGICHGTQQFAANQQQKVTFSHGKAFQIGFLNFHGRNNGMVIRHILIGNGQRNQGIEITAGINGRQLCRQMDKDDCGFLHIRSQKAAVSTGIGQQLLFIEGLGIFQSLLGRIAEDPVCLPLQGGQVIELRGIFLLLLLGHRSTDHFAFRAIHQGRLCLGKVLEAFGQHFGSVQIQLHMVEFFLFEGGDPALTLHQHCQGRRLDTAHIQGAVVQNGEQTGSIDTNQPVGFLTAQGAMVQGIVLAAGAQFLETFPDRAVLHGRDPEAFHRLCASGHAIDQPEDKFTLTARVTGIDDGIHIGTVHKVAEIVKSILFARCQYISERLREDGKIIIMPLFIAFIITGRVHGRYQMAHTPGNDKTVAFIKAIGPGYCTQGRSDRFCYTQFFCYN